MGINYKGHKEFPVKKFYWATSSFIFSPLPAVEIETEKEAAMFNVYFTGEHEKILKPADPTTGRKDFTELQRLAYVVSKIERDTHVVPQGSFKFTPIQEIRKNEIFKGLNDECSKKLEFYQHFRPVETQEMKELLERNEGILQTDVFDSLASDNVKGSWSLQIGSGSQITVRSLLWPGYTFYHICLTGIYGGLYIGDGLMNKDLPFML